MKRFMIGTIQIGNDNKESSHKKHQFEFVTELTSSDYWVLKGALSTINHFMQDSQLFMITTWNFKEFSELINYYLQSYKNKDFDIFVQKPINININRAFLNFLSSIRSYLDFMERLLKKTVRRRIYDI